MMRRLPRPTVLALVAATALVGAACGDDPTGNEGHPDPSGLVVLSGGVDVVEVRGLGIIGSFAVSEGGTSADYQIQLIDQQGNRYSPTAADQWLRVIVANPAVAQWVQDDVGEWGGRLEGLTGGTTTIGFDLMHGPVGDEAASHFDYRTPNIPVLVN